MAERTLASLPPLQSLANSALVCRALHSCAALEKCAAAVLSGVRCVAWCQGIGEGLAMRTSLQHKQPLESASICSNSSMSSASVACGAQEALRRSVAGAITVAQKSCHGKAVGTDSGQAAFASQVRVDLALRADLDRTYDGACINRLITRKHSIQNWLSIITGAGRALLLSNRRLSFVKTY